jgi:hypothetical protein
VKTKDTIARFQEDSKEKTLEQAEQMKKASQQQLRDRAALVMGSFGEGPHDILDFNELQSAADMAFAGSSGNAFDGEGLLSADIGDIISDVRRRGNKRKAFGGEEVEDDDQDMDDELDEGGDGKGGGTPGKKRKKDEVDSSPNKAEWVDIETKLNRATRNFNSQVDKLTDSMGQLCDEIAAEVKQFSGPLAQEQCTEQNDITNECCSMSSTTMRTWQVTIGLRMPVACCQPTLLKPLCSEFLC